MDLRIILAAGALALISSAAFAAAPASSSGPLAAAKAHLKAGKYDLVVDDLSSTSHLEKGPAAQVFADAAEMAQAKGDRAFASLYCERALALAPNEPRVLQACAMVAQRREQAASDESFEGDEAATPDDSEAKIAAALRASRDATREADLKESARAEQSQQEARKKWRPLGEKVILYSMHGCPACEKARQWLEENGVEFEERATDRSGQSAREAQRISLKARAWVFPIVVVNGTPVMGFDVEKLKALLEL